MTTLSLSSIQQSCEENKVGIHLVYQRRVRPTQMKRLSLRWCWLASEPLWICFQIHVEDLSCLWLGV